MSGTISDYENHVRKNRCIEKISGRLDIRKDIHIQFKHNQQLILFIKLWYRYNFKQSNENRSNTIRTSESCVNTAKSNKFSDRTTNRTINLSPDDSNPEPTSKRRDRKLFWTESKIFPPSKRTHTWYTYKIKGISVSHVGKLWFTQPTI